MSDFLVYRGHDTWHSSLNSGSKAGTDVITIVLSSSMPLPHHRPHHRFTPPIILLFCMSIPQKNSEAGVILELVLEVTVRRNNAKLVGLMHCCSFSPLFARCSSLRLSTTLCLAYIPIAASIDTGVFLLISLLPGSFPLQGTSWASFLSCFYI